MATLISNDALEELKKRITEIVKILADCKEPLSNIEKTIKDDVGLAFAVHSEQGERMTTGLEALSTILGKNMEEIDKVITETNNYIAKVEEANKILS